MEPREEGLSGCNRLPEGEGEGRRTGEGPGEELGLALAEGSELDKKLRLVRGWGRVWGLGVWRVEGCSLGHSGAIHKTS